MDNIKWIFKDEKFIDRESIIKQSLVHLSIKNFNY